MSVMSKSIQHRFHILRSTAIVAVMVTLGIQSAAAQAPIEMIMTNEIASSHWTTTIMDRFAADIEKRSEGRIKPKVFHAGTLYNDQDAIASLGTGAVHMVWPVAVRLETVAPEAGVLTLPFALNDEMMLKDGAPLAVGKYLSNYLSPRGIQVVGVMRTADLFFLTRKNPIEKLGDLDRLKIRATGGRILLELLAGYRASAISMPAPEMGPAIAQGTIDGALTSAGGWEMVGADSAPYASLVPGLSLLTYAVLLDQDWVQSLPDDLGKIVVDVTTEYVSTTWQEAIDLDRKAQEHQISIGGKYSEVEGAARAEFIESASEVTAGWREKYPEAWASFEETMAPFK